MKTRDWMGRRSPGRFYSRLMVALLALVVAIMPASRALAQGTSGALPDPINGGDLNRYCDKLNLDAAQRKSVEEMHEKYKEQFRQLRESDIEKFLQDMNKLQRGGQMPKRTEMEDFVRDHKRMINKIESVDNALLSQIESVLTTDEQRTMLPRIRMARERARYRTQMMAMVGMLNPSAGIDLSEMFAELKLTPEQRAKADPAVATYEAKLTSASKDLHDTTMTMFVDLIDALEKMGFSEETMSDPEQAQKMFAAMRDAWKEVGKKSTARACAISELNRQTVKSLSEVLPPGVADRLRSRFYRRGYPEAFEDSQEIETQFRLAQRYKSLTPEQVEALKASFTDFNDKNDRLTTKMLDLVDDWRKTRSPMDFMGGEDTQQHEKKLQEMKEQRTQLVATAKKNISDVLGQGLSERLAKGDVDKDATLKDLLGEELAGMVGDVEGGSGAPATSEGAMVEAGNTPPTPPGVEEIAQAEEVPQGMDPFLPPAIGARELGVIGKFLGLSDDQRELLNSMHHDYSESFNAITENQIKALQEANGAMWRQGTDGQMQGPTVEQVDRIYTLRRAAQKAIRDLDESFFNDLEAALASDDQKTIVQHLRLSRERTACNRSGWAFGYMPGKAREPGIDLVMMVGELRLTSADIAKIDSILSEYDAATTPAMRSKFQGALDMQKELDKLQAEQMAGIQEDRSKAVSFGVKYQQIMKDYAGKIKQQEETIVSASRSGLAKLILALPDEASRSLRDSYNHRAYPDVYNDKDSAGPKIKAALELRDLSDDQRRGLNEISSDFSAGYDRMCEQMVQAYAAGSGTSMTFDEDNMRDYQARENSMEKLRFERRELSSQALRRLRAALTPEQIERVGGLEEREHKTRNPWDGNSD